MPSSAALTQMLDNYCCPKCHNRAYRTEEVQLMSANAPGITKVLGLGNGKYLVVTCTLCGYSELFNTQVFERQAERETAKAAAAPQVKAGVNQRTSQSG